MAKLERTKPSVSYSSLRFFHSSFVPLIPLWMAALWGSTNRLVVAMAVRRWLQVWQWLPRADLRQIQPSPPIFRRRSRAWCLRWPLPLGLPMPRRRSSSVGIRAASPALEADLRPTHVVSVASRAAPAAFLHLAMVVSSVVFHEGIRRLLHCRYLPPPLSLNLIYSCYFRYAHTYGQVRHRFVYIWVLFASVDIILVSPCIGEDRHYWIIWVPVSLLITT